MHQQKCTWIDKGCRAKTIIFCQVTSWYKKYRRDIPGLSQGSLSWWFDDRGNAPRKSSDFDINELWNDQPWNRKTFFFRKLFNLEANGSHGGVPKLNFQGVFRWKWWFDGLWKSWWPPSVNRKNWKKTILNMTLLRKHVIWEVSTAYISYPFFVERRSGWVGVILQLSYLLACLGWWNTHPSW